MIAIKIGSIGTSISHDLHQETHQNNAPDLVHVLGNEGNLHIFSNHILLLLIIKYIFLIQIYSYMICESCNPKRILFKME